MRSTLALSALAAINLLLSGCVSLGGAEPPDSLLTLTSTATAPAGTATSVGSDDSPSAISILTPEVPAKLDVLRVPVQVSQTEIAYLQEAFWVEKPARLFRRLIGETLRARETRLVIDSDDTPVPTNRTLTGNLLEMGYDASTSSVVVRYDAIHTDEEGKVQSRRFEARESGVIAETEFVGPALNRVANTVAGEIAEWVESDL